MVSGRSANIVISGESPTRPHIRLMIVDLSTTAPDHEGLPLMRLHMKTRTNPTKALKVGYKVADELESLGEWDQDVAARIIASHMPSLDVELDSHLDAAERAESARRQVQESKCKIRGDGSCPCVGQYCCALVDAKQARLDSVIRMQARINRILPNIENELRRLKTPKATIKSGWSLPALMGSYTPVAHNTGDGFVWGWEDEEGEFTAGDEPSDLPTIDWPFEQDYVWSDDWERAGFEIR